MPSQVYSRAIASGIAIALTRANGQPTFAAYVVDHKDGTLHTTSLVVVTLSAGERRG